MIVFFGPAGAGKSVQGQLLAARNNWRWLSSGQLLREANDLQMLEEMRAGNLISPQVVNQLMDQALARAKEIDHVILDGYPRLMEQATWLVEAGPRHNRAIQLVIVLEVPRSELMKRLAVRGRADDTPETIDRRLQVYRTEMYPILTYLTEQDVRIVHVDGTGTVGQVHDRIMEEIEALGLAQ